ncbi:MAG: MarR family transcriptional regulator [Chloroflexi bacterium]|nr:MAG: MarR family transcriptional regulator [Chloroflexota bacterium]
MPPTILDTPEQREKWIAFIHSLNPDTDARAIRLMDEMRMVGRTLHIIGEHSLAESGLSYAQYRILMSLFFCENMEGRNGMNPSEISERQGTSRNTISSLVRSLEEQGLVKRELDPQDRRKFNIQLTENGRSLVRQHASRHFRIIHDFFSTLTADEQETLSQLLAKMRTAALQQAEKQTQPE